MAAALPRGAHARAVQDDPARAIRPRAGGVPRGVPGRPAPPPPAPPASHAPTSSAPSRDLVNALFDPIAFEQGAPRWVEMSPRNVQFAPELLRMFPRMKLVYTVRDGRDVACSLAGLPFGPETALEALERWDRHLRRADASVRRLPADRVHTVRLEELAAHATRGIARRAARVPRARRGRGDPPRVRLRADGRERSPRPVANRARRRRARRARPPVSRSARRRWRPTGSRRGPTPIRSRRTTRRSPRPGRDRRSIPGRTGALSAPSDPAIRRLTGSPSDGRHPPGSQCPRAAPRRARRGRRLGGDELAARPQPGRGRAEGPRRPARPGVAGRRGAATR